VFLSNAPDVSSDSRLKKNVKASDLGIDFINSLRPVSWNWKDQSQGSALHYGVIAQEVELAMARAKGHDSDDNSIVSHDEKNDIYSVRYTELISPLIKAVQDLYQYFLAIKEIVEHHSQKIMELQISKADQASLQAANLRIQNLEAENIKIKVQAEKQNQENLALRSRLDEIEKILKSK
jgi:hypothetical protein